MSINNYFTLNDKSSIEDNYQHNNSKQYRSLNDYYSNEITEHDEQKNYNYDDLDNKKSDIINSFLTYLYNNNSNLIIDKNNLNAIFLIFKQIISSGNDEYSVSILMNINNFEIKYNTMKLNSERIVNNRNTFQNIINNDINILKKTRTKDESLIKDDIAFDDTNKKFDINEKQEDESKTTSKKINFGADSSLKKETKSKDNKFSNMIKCYSFKENLFKEKGNQLFKIKNMKQRNHSFDFNNKTYLFSVGKDYELKENTYNNSNGNKSNKSNRNSENKSSNQNIIKKIIHINEKYNNYNNFKCQSTKAESEKIKIGNYFNNNLKGEVKEKENNND